MRAVVHDRARALRKRRSSSFLVQLGRDLDGMFWAFDSRFANRITAVVVLGAAVYLLGRIVWSWTHGGS